MIETGRLDRIINKYNMGEAEVEALIDRIKNPGMVIENIVHDWGKRRIRIGLTGDFHIGSLYTADKARDDFFKRLKKHKPDAIYNTGDMTEGWNMRPGHTLECDLHGADAQVRGVVERVPDIGIPHYFITGNHDHAHWKNGGVDVGKWIDSERSDLHYLGRDNAIIEISPETTLQLLHPAGGSAYAVCFDDETEILSEDGWVLFKDLKKGVRVATLSSDDVFEWQEPTDYTDEEYYDDMVYFDSRTVNLLVTPNHRMCVRRYPTRANKLNKVLKMPQKARKQADYSWKFIEAKDLVGGSRQSWQMKRGGQDWKGELSKEIDILHRWPKKYASTPIKHLVKLNIEDIAELIAWYVTEGSIHRNGKSLNISQSLRVNPENHYRIVDLLKRIGFNPTPRGRDKKDIVVSSVELCDFLNKEGGSGSKNKFLPKWLKNQPKEILEIVFDTMIAGDGWVNGRGFGYRSISKRLLDDFSEIAIKLGYATTTYEDVCSVSSVQIYPTINKSPQVIKYVGRIYCVSVPNKIILVRRNGRVIWSGNSYKPQKIIESLSGGTKPNILATGHFHKAEYLFYRNVHSLQTGTFQAQTPFMQTKGLSAHISGWLLDIYTKKDGSIDRIDTKFFPYYE
jgi:hypothetical protein